MATSYKETILMAIDWIIEGKILEFVLRKRIAKIGANKKYKNFLADNY